MALWRCSGAQKADYHWLPWDCVTAQRGSKETPNTVLRKKAVAFWPVRAITLPNGVMDGSHRIEHSVLCYGSFP